MTDLHLDKAAEVTRNEFYHRLANTQCERFVITGDISNAAQLPTQLRDLALVCAPRPVAFVLGNHDFYGSSIGEVENRVAQVCLAHPNLLNLAGGEIMPIDSETVLVGHHGWADGQAGFGNRSWAHQPDHDLIEDFKNCSKAAQFALMEKLGRESARHLRDVLPEALSHYKRTVVATHVPPFRQAVRFDNAACDATRLPHFVNLATGNVIAGIAKQFPKKSITVLCGHTHSRARVKITSNVQAFVGAARSGKPIVEAIFSPS
jgi:predicted phosphohydrolase